MKDFDYAAWKAMAGVRECSACVFYSGSIGQGSGGFGYCHRLPPALFDPEYGSWSHPKVTFNNWCGEFVFNPDTAKEPEHVFHSPSPEPGQLK